MAQARIAQQWARIETKTRTRSNQTLCRTAGRGAFSRPRFFFATVRRGTGGCPCPASSAAAAVKDGFRPVAREFRSDAGPTISPGQKRFLVPQAVHWREKKRSRIGTTAFSQWGGVIVSPPPCGPLRNDSGGRSCHVLGWRPSSFSSRARAAKQSGWLTARTPIQRDCQAQRGAASNSPRRTRRATPTQGRQSGGSASKSSAARIARLCVRRAATRSGVLSSGGPATANASPRRARVNPARRHSRRISSHVVTAAIPIPRGAGRRVFYSSQLLRIYE